MPHRPVVNTNRNSKVRPVFDASAKGPNGVSLNDCMVTGPALTPDIVEILLRFRRWPFAIPADIAKAFLQFKVHDSDKDDHRFLLTDSKGSERHMLFCRVPFGYTASPYLLNATIKFHLSKYPQDEVVQELQTNMYVDNWLNGGDSVSDILRA